MQGEVRLKTGGVDVDEQEPLAVVDKLSGCQAVLVGGGVAVGAGENQSAFFPAFGQQLVEVRSPGPVVADVAAVAVPGLFAPFQVGSQLWDENKVSSV